MCASSVVHRGSATVPVTGGRRAEEELSERAPLHELVTAAPHLRAELQQRGRASALLVVAFAALVLPSWTGFGLLLEPAQVGRFGLVRALCAVPMLAVLWLLWRRPVGLRRPQLLTIAVLTLVQLDIAWMATRVTHVEAYLMGLSLALYGSGCVLAGRPRWTGGLIAVTWLALAVAALLPGSAVGVESLTTGVHYLATASIIAIVAHVLRQRVTVSELGARVRLEREQDRTSALLSRLDRLSHEDPLTGLANRRRWDAELSTVCAEARAKGTDVAVVLLDLDHFKQVNDRYGHAGGDEALRAVAALVRGAVRSGDLVARLGGDEFGILLPRADLERTVDLARALRERGRELQPAGFEPGAISLSLGVAVATGARAYPLELVSCADAQLYRAKITRDAVGAPIASPFSRCGGR
ncbi:diguanylate cyclase [Blastococcus sp. SYSU D00669]